MTRKWLVLAALLVSSLVGSRPADAMICGGGYSQTESNHTVFEHACYEYYFNNSGASRPSGDVVIFDTTGTGVNSGVIGSYGTPIRNNASRSAVDTDPSDGDVTNIGTYITTTTTADSVLVAGVIDDDSCADQSYCRVQVRGPRLVKCADSTDAITSGSAVGTTTIAGQVGGGNGVGVALDAGDTYDGNTCWVWIMPGGNR